MSDALELLLTKKECEHEHLFFTRYFFKARQSIKFRVNWHHVYLADILDQVIQGKIKNLVINIPPGSSKTEEAVINFMARGLAINPRSRFLHLTGSDSLASLNSQTARDLVLSEEFQQLWPMKIADDSKSKKRWNVMIGDQQAGGVYATAIGGQVTGFRAGHMAEGFQGAIIIDDPVKPEDAFSTVKLQAVNRKLQTTVKSRKANPDTPFILIMQRVGTHDPTEFIKSGNLDELGEITYVKIPALIDKAYVASLPKKYRALIEPSETDSQGRFSYWPYKEPLKQLLAMEQGGGADAEGVKISRHVFNSQYQQEPISLGGNLIKGEHFRYYKPEQLPKIRYRKIFADTAQKTKEHNDFSVFEEWGLGVDGNAYLLDMIRGKWEAPELQKRAIAFWAKAKAKDTDKFGMLREMPVEDKASGTGLIQTLRLPPYNIPIKAIERDKDKLTRAMDALPYIEAGQVYLPEDAPFTSDFVSECEAFSADMTHAHDDQLDPALDAIEDMLSKNNKINQWIALGK